MARDIKEEHQPEEGSIRLVQDRRDDPERTDRWFVELNLQIRFMNDTDARRFLQMMKVWTTPR